MFQRGHLLALGFEFLDPEWLFHQAVVIHWLQLHIQSLLKCLPLFSSFPRSTLLLLLLILILTRYFGILITFIICIPFNLFILLLLLHLRSQFLVSLLKLQHSFIWILEDNLRLRSLLLTINFQLFDLNSYFLW